MNNKNFQKIISSLLVLSIAFAVPYLTFVKTTKAQSVSSYVTGISGAITQLPLCTSKQTNNIKSAFSGGSGISGGISTLIDEGQNYIGDEQLDEVVSDAISSQDVAVYDKEVNKKIDKQQKDIEDLKETNAAMSANDTCLKSIGRLIIKMLLQKLTISTVDWINNGYEGAPFFVQDPGKYFSDLGKEQLYIFGQEINDPELYPYGKAFMQAQANSYKNKFANNAQYSLDKLIYNSSNGLYNANDFQEDFSKGGWAAWDAMIQNSANNPLGFSLMASNELAKRIEDKTRLAEGALQYGSGFLGMDKCADPRGVTREEHEKGLLELKKASGTGPTQNRICNRWETVTPGSAIASIATDKMQNEETSLLKADDLNDAIAALIDAFANSMTSKIQTDGFFSLSSSDSFQEGMGGQFVYDEDSMTDYNSPRVEQDFSEFQIGQSTFLSTHPDFDIRNDLTQALIDEQRTFVDKLIEQNKELFSSDPNIKPLKENNYITGNYGLIPTIYQLDYCIPGPHPGWENDSKQILGAALDTIIPEDTNSLTDREEEEITGMITESLALVAGTVGMALGASIGSAIPVLGTAIGAVAGAIVGYLVGVVVDLFDGPSGEELARMYYNGHFVTFTNTPIKTCGEGQDCDGDTDQKIAMGNPTLHNKGSFVDTMYIILSRYTEIVNDVYKPELLPSVTKKSEENFFKLKGYGKIMQNNEDKIISMKSIVSRLTGIKKEIDNLNNKLKSGEITQENYNKDLEPWISSFSRVSAEMVSGDDIAKVDNMTKQIIDQKDYIYKDLLKGPNGCEKSLELRRGSTGQDGTGLPWAVYDAKRPYYGVPILYDYNNFTNKTFLPDPYESGFKTNKLPQTEENGKVAILPKVQFENSEGEWCGNNYPKYINKHGIGQKEQHGTDIAGPLCIHDLVPLRDYSGWVHDKFEKVIGIW